MKPAMSADELNLFLCFIRNSTSYLEFGTGGSTFVASQNVKESIISVDSSQEWLDKVMTACTGSKVVPKLIYVDIGKVGDWGVPLEREKMETWPRYHENVWEIGESANADLIMVDGRFRVACFAQAVLRGKRSAIIGIHDFNSRPQYHCVRDMAREIASVESLSFFQPRDDARERAENILKHFRLDPS